MYIHCPHCGPRHIEEFVYLGDATRARPADDAPQADWCAYLFARRNPKGVHQEYWQHVAGCRAILKVTRDTRTHTIIAVELVGPHAVAPSADETDRAAITMEPAQ